MAKPLQIVNGLATEVPAVNVSAGAGDAGKIPELNASGRLDETMMPPGIGADTKVFPATETMTAGDFVNIYDDGGTASVKLADASEGPSGMAHGFVRDNVTSGNPATVYFEGPNDQLSGLTPGVSYVLSHTTPGGVVALSAASTTATHILQQLGAAVAADEINVEIEKPIVRG